MGAEAKKTKGAEAEMGKISKTWAGAASSDGHRSEDATNGALFNSGCGGHPAILDDGGDGLEHPGDTSKRSPNRKAGGGIAAGGAVLTDLQKYSLLCRGHKLNDPNPNAVPLIDIIRKEGAKTLKEFKRRAKVAEQAAIALDALQLKVGEALKAVKSAKKAGDACEAALKDWLEQWKNAEESAGDLKEKAADAGKGYLGQGQAIGSLVDAADKLAQNLCKKQQADMLEGF
jgi:hypothetical protein